MLLDPRIGLGLRAPHIEPLLAQRPALGWLEIHSENWFAQGGQIAARLTDLRSYYPISLHGVGLSLGSADGLQRSHLQKLKNLVDRVNPILISEHLSWGRVGDIHSNDLLPMPYTKESIQVLVQHIDQTQQYLGRQILVENVSSYMSFAESSMPEWVFIQQVIEQAGCGLLLDLNNVYVNAVNHQFSAQTYLDQLPWQAVQEIHLAGYSQDGTLLIDTHSRAVQPEVWKLYQIALPHLYPTTRTLIEWDADLPELDILLEEAQKAALLLMERADV